MDNINRSQIDFKLINKWITDRREDSLPVLGLSPTIQWLSFDGTHCIRDINYQMIAFLHSVWIFALIIYIEWSHGININ